MEYVKTNIKPSEVKKVMKEVGYDKASPTQHSSIADQLAEANARPQKSMADAINKAMEKVVARKNDIPVPVPVIKITQKKPDIKAALESLDDIEVPVLSEKATEDNLEEENVQFKELKTVTIDMTDSITKIKFTGDSWIPMDIRRAGMELIRAFKIKIRDEYRKGTKK